MAERIETKAFVHQLALRVSRYIPMAHQEESGPMYNQTGVDALDAVRSVVASFGAPLVFRKLYGILNASRTLKV